jgi:broad specificity phosphatase PhoE
VTVFHLVRHADHGLLGKVLTGRMPGVKLSEHGQAQAQALAQSFSTRPITAVVSSPLERAQQTAAPIAAILGLNIKTEAALNEIDFGAWTGMAFDALHDLPAWHIWNQFRGTAATPGGETMLQALARAFATLTLLRVAHPNDEVVLVSHQDVLKAIVAHSLGMPLDLMHRIELAPASRSILRVFENGDMRVDRLNLPP